ncbi:MAG: Fur family transcriptional regulator [Chloroflexota bacterium]
MDVTVEAILSHLAAEGFSLTGQRRTLVTLIMSQANLFTAEDLLVEARRGGGAGRATVFRTLDLLARLGYVGRVFDGDRQAYVVCAPEHHHHLVCSACGKVLHLAGCPVDDYLRQVECTTGFQIDVHNLQLSGLCPQCRLGPPAQR